MLPELSHQNNHIIQRTRVGGVYILLFVILIDIFIQILILLLQDIVKIHPYTGEFVNGIWILKVPWTLTTLCVAAYVLQGLTRLLSSPTVV